MLALQNIFQSKRLFKAIALGVALALTACGGGSSGKKSESSGILQNPYFYSVTSDEGQVSYMFGTVHIGVSIKEVPSYIIDAYVSTKYHFSEITQVYEPVDASYLVAQSMYSRPTFEAAYARYKSKIKSQGAELTPDQKRRALYIGVPDYVVDVMGQDAACQFALYGEVIYKSPAPFLDYDLAAISLAHNKQTFGLENSRIRKEADDYARSNGQRNEDGGDCTVAKYLASDEVAAAVKGLLNQRPLTAMINKYRSGVGFDDSDDDYSMRYRNKSWIPVMKPYLKKGNAFFSFGAGHMEGYYGIVQHLQREGFKVVRLHSSIPLRVENPDLAFEQSLIQKYEDRASSETKNQFIMRPLEPTFGSL